jgi:hypothetical protein
MKSTIKLIFILIAILFASVVFSKILAQDINFNNIEMEDGLITNSIYEVFQDSLGNMWFATDMGVCKYDGYDFTYYTTNDGLTHNVVFQIREFNNRIYFNTFKGGICYLSGDSILPYTHNDILLREIGQNIVLNFIFEKDILWFDVNRTNNLLSIDEEGDIDEVSFNDDAMFFIKNIGDNVISGFSNQYLESESYSVSKHVLGESYIIMPTLPTDVMLRPQIRGDYFAYAKTLFLDRTTQSDEPLVETFSENISALLTDSNNDFWVGTRGGGVIRYSNSDFKAIPNRFLEGLTISDIYEDSQGNLWFSTTERGVYFFNIHKSKNFNFDEQILALKAMGKNTFCSSENGKLFLFRGDSIQPIFQNHDKTALKDIYLFDENHILTDNKIINFNTLEVSDFEYALPDSNNIYIDHGKYFVSGYTGFNLSIGANLIYDSQDEGLSLYVKEMLSLAEDSLLILSQSGLSLFSKNTNETVLIDSINELEITSLANLNEYLLISTRIDGIYLLDHSFNIIHQYNNSNGLSSNICRDVCVANNKVYIATNKGVDVLTQVGIDKELDNNIIINKLYHNNVNCLIASGENIVIGTDDGIEVFEDTIQKYHFNSSYISSFIVNGVSVDVGDQSFGHEENNIDISFVSPNYDYEIRYNYRLVGATNDWTETERNTVKFSRLAPGEYIFEMRPFVSGQLGEIASIGFSVAPHFTRSWWFLSLIAIICITVVYLIILSVKQSELYKREAIESTQTALRAQMNPHFLFNALNSIQNYILMNEKELSLKYLNKFSTLVRQVLENSNHKLVSIKDDLEALEHYIQIEAVRFEDRFNYEVIIEDEVDKHNFLIPPLLLQPIVENAIWHGIMHKESGKGEITIRYKFMGDSLVCLISDNGVGVKKAREIEGVNDAVSYGLKITKGRLKVFNKDSRKESSEKYSISVRDINKGGTVSGTEVEVEIPILISK